MKRSNKIFLTLIVGVIILLTLIGVAFFIFKFSGYPLSNKIEDWGSFGAYFSFIISIINTIVIGILSYLVYSAQTKRDLFEKEYIEAEQKPILIFAEDFKEKNHTSTSIKGQIPFWYVYNVGKGAALNVIIAESYDTKTWVSPKKCYSLAPNEKVPITWFIGANRILGIYSDIFSDKIYTSICMGDETSFESYNKKDLNNTHWINKIRNEATRLG